MGYNFDLNHRATRISTAEILGQQMYTKLPPLIYFFMTVDCEPKLEKCNGQSAVVRLDALQRDTRGRIQEWPIIPIWIRQY